MQKILLATDGSESSNKTAEFAKSLIEAWPAAQVVAVYVSRPVTLPVGIPYGGIGYEVESSRTMQTYEESIAQHIKQQVEDVFQLSAERVRFVHKEGNPVGEIVALAEEEHVDFIVIGSHGAGAIDRLLLGSVSHGVLNRTKRPVLVVR